MYVNMLHMYVCICCALQDVIIFVDLVIVIYFLVEMLLKVHTYVHVHVYTCTNMVLTRTDRFILYTHILWLISYGGSIEAQYVMHVTGPHHTHHACVLIFFLRVCVYYIRFDISMFSLIR